MTRRTPSVASTESGRGRVPFGSIVRGARADAAPLVVGMIVVALVAFLTAVTPRLEERVAADEIRAAVEDPGARADVVAYVPLTEGFSVPRSLPRGTAEDSAWISGFLNNAMPPVFDTPVTTIVSGDFTVSPLTAPPTRVQLAYVDRQRSTGVEWVEGRAPAETDGAVDLAASGGGVPIEVGLSQDVAAALDVEVGDTVTVTESSGASLTLVVTGVFRAVDPADPVWADVPTVLQPRVVGGAAGRTEVAALLSDASLPVARLALDPGAMTRTFTFPVRPDALDMSNASEVATTIRRLASGSDQIGSSWLGTTLRTSLDSDLDGAVARVNSASAQAALVLTGVLASALAVVLLAAGLVVQRRTTVITHQRMHGASVLEITAALLLESVVVTAIAGAIGLAVAGTVVPGVISWSWVAPPLALAALAGPGMGARVASRRMAPPPARRLDMRPGIRSAGARRLALEATVVLLAIASLAALRARGVAASANALGADVVVLAAPALAIVVAAIALLRVLPPAWRWARRATQRTRGAVPALTAARTQTAALPLTAIVLATGLLASALVLDSTVRAGQVAGSWDAVGGDVAVSTTNAAGLPVDAGLIAGRPGVVATARASVQPGSQILGDGVDMLVRVVVVDPSELEAMLEASPLPDAPDLSLLAGTAAVGDRGAIPALASGVPRGAKEPTLIWRGANVAISVVGVAPALPGDHARGTPTVFVSRGALAAATAGADLSSSVAATDVLWVVGDGAEIAARDTLGDEDVTIATRASWLENRRSAPVIAAVAGAFLAGAGVLVALGVLAVGLMASADARRRGAALAGFRVLGLRRRQASRVAFGEALLPVVVAAIVGTAAGIAVSHWIVGPLGLSALTGQRGTPALDVPWWVYSPALLLALAVIVFVSIELAGHRRERLGQVMRAG